MQFATGKSIVKTEGRHFFYTSSIDKLSKNAEGQYFNFLVDGFITSGAVKEFVYAEKSNEGDFRKPSPAPIDLKIDLLNELNFFFRRKIKNQAQIEIAANKFSELFNRSFQKFSIHIPAPTINDLLVAFFTELGLYKFILNLFHPRLIITSEQPGTALLAAANEKNIPSIDLQHGLIDEYHPMYQFSARMRQIPSKMILPTYIGVFGKFHGQILTRHEFWEDRDIRVLGSFRMEEIRAKKKSTTQDKFRILLPTQWTVLAETKILLAALKERKALGFTIVLKPHPLEPETNKTFYQGYCEFNPDWTEFAHAKSDIYELIGSSKLILGFDSTTLLECLCLGIPSITLGLSNLPKGIHSLLGNDFFSDVIKCVPLTDFGALFKLISDSMNDASFYSDWKSKSLMKGEELYASNYYQNIRSFVAETEAR